MMMTGFAASAVKEINLPRPRHNPETKASQGRGISAAADWPLAGSSSAATRTRTRFIMRIVSLWSATTVAWALVVASLAAFGNPTRAAQSQTEQTVKPIYAISYVIGSKRAVGYFQPIDGKCDMTLMIAEATDPNVALAPSAARLSLSMEPGQSAGLGTEEGESMVLTCGAGAATMLVRRLSARDGHLVGNKRPLAVAGPSRLPLSGPSN